MRVLVMAVMYKNWVESGCVRRSDFPVEIDPCDALPRNVVFNTKELRATIANAKCHCSPLR